MTDPAQMSRMYQLLEQRKWNPDQFRMRAGVERDLAVVGQALVNVHIEPVEIAEWRHRAGFAVGEQRRELVLCGEFRRFAAGSQTQRGEVEAAVGAEHHHR